VAEIRGRPLSDERNDEDRGRVLKEPLYLAAPRPIVAELRGANAIGVRLNRQVDEKSRLARDA